MITIVPDGGLCNRMRSIAAACILSRRTEQPLRVTWYRTPYCNARFETLFSTTDVPFDVRDPWAMAGVVREGVRLWERCRYWSGEGYIPRSRATPQTFDEALAAIVARRGNLYVRSFAKFLSEPNMFAPFVPAAAVQHELDELRPRLAGATGVHIRRTDNQKAIAESPMSAFIALMEGELVREPNTQFFVATDAPAAFEELSARFGECVFEYPKESLRRDNPAGIFGAVVDLYALASCRKIIGSHWSSFTDTAAELSGIERVIARAT